MVGSNYQSTLQQLLSADLDSVKLLLGQTNVIMALQQLEVTRDKNLITRLWSRFSASPDTLDAFLKGVKPELHDSKFLVDKGVALASKSESQIVYVLHKHFSKSSGGAFLNDTAAGLWAHSFATHGVKEVEKVDHCVPSVVHAEPKADTKAHYAPQQELAPFIAEPLVLDNGAFQAGIAVSRGMADRVSGNMVTASGIVINAVMVEPAVKAAGGGNVEAIRGSVVRTGYAVLNAARAAAGLSIADHNILKGGDTASGSEVEFAERLADVAEGVAPANLRAASLQARTDLRAGFAKGVEAATQPGFMLNALDLGLTVAWEYPHIPLYVCIKWIPSCNETLQSGTAWLSNTTIVKQTLSTKIGSDLFEHRTEMGWGVWAAGRTTLIWKGASPMHMARFGIFTGVDLVVDRYLQPESRNFASCLQVAGPKALSAAVAAWPAGIMAVPLALGRGVHSELQCVTHGHEKPNLGLPLYAADATAIALVIGAGKVGFVSTLGVPGFLASGLAFVVLTDSSARMGLSTKEALTFVDAHKQEINPVIIGGGVGGTIGALSSIHAAFAATSKIVGGAAAAGALTSGGAAGTATTAAAVGVVATGKAAAAASVAAVCKVATAAVSLPMVGGVVVGAGLGAAWAYTPQSFSDNAKATVVSYATSARTQVVNYTADVYSRVSFGTVPIIEGSARGRSAHASQGQDKEAPHYFLSSPVVIKQTFASSVAAVVSVAPPLASSPAPAQATPAPSAGGDTSTTSFHDLPKVLAADGNIGSFAAASMLTRSAAGRTPVLPPPVLPGVGGAAKASPPPSPSPAARPDAAHSKARSATPSASREATPAAPGEAGTAPKKAGWFAWMWPAPTEATLIRQMHGLTDRVEGQLRGIQHSGKPLAENPNIVRAIAKCKASESLAVYDANLQELRTTINARAKLAGKGASVCPLLDEMARVAKTPFKEQPPMPIDDKAPLIEDPEAGGTSPAGPAPAPEKAVPQKSTYGSWISHPTLADIGFAIEEVFANYGGLQYFYHKMIAPVWKKFANSESGKHILLDTRLGQVVDHSIHNVGLAASKIGENLDAISNNSFVCFDGYCRNFAHGAAIGGAIAFRTLVTPTATLRDAFVRGGTYLASSETSKLAHSLQPKEANPSLDKYLVPTTLAFLSGGSSTVLVVWGLSRKLVVGAPLTLAMGGVSAATASLEIYTGGQVIDDTGSLPCLTAALVGVMALTIAVFTPPLFCAAAGSTAAGGAAAGLVAMKPAVFTIGSVVAKGFLVLSVVDSTIHLTELGMTASKDMRDFGHSVDASLSSKFNSSDAALKGFMESHPAWVDPALGSILGGGMFGALGMTIAMCAGFAACPVIGITIGAGALGAATTAAAVCVYEAGHPIEVAGTATQPPVVEMGIA